MIRRPLVLALALALLPSAGAQAEDLMQAYELARAGDPQLAIAESNRLPIGLAGYAFTRSLRNSDLLARKLEVGMLWMNMPALPSAEMPFGGVKDSGYGSEGGPEAMEAYLNSRAVVIQNA